MDRSAPCAAFLGTEFLARGPLERVAPMALARPGALVFDEGTGRIIDLDPRDWTGPPPAPRRGRPRLGVVAREVTLLDRHWDWLAAQPGGASAALRRLVEAARRAEGGTAKRRDATYRAMQALGGDLPGFEEATRALYAGDMDAFESRLAPWPAALRDWLVSLTRP